MIGKSNRSILFLGKKKDKHCSDALQFLKKNFSEVTAYLSEWGEPLPEDIGNWNGDFIISYLSRWVVPEYLINKASVASINFHPAPPEYPGIGCNNFALYENAKQYGVTCHYMDAKVDTGKIISVKRFPIFPGDDVNSLLMRTYSFQIILFYEIAGLMLRNEPLPFSEEAWTRKPFTRKEFNELSRITPSMTAEEIDRRVRATSYGVFQPTVELCGHVFELKTNKE